MNLFIGDGGHAKVVRTLCHYDPKNWICAVGDNAARKKEVEAHPEYAWTTAISPSITAKHSPVGPGTVVMAGVIIQPGCKIGRHVILNSGCTVDHDCVLEDYVHIAPGAHLCGNVHVGEGALVGVGVGVPPGTKIPAWSIVKAHPLVIVPCPTK